ncbi:UPF0331 protein YutE [Lentibacillus sp. JNUCC-1]|uniref:DUF86 domain-containing protein n=1 Tax=Lentibacillus sp. JNUCC-1 TaxID=2654513 RepID=UPI00132A72F4|nr:DUF86 domain-containing protein [Lentibacillus sp. JNUCC-1]MUV39212.1 UPF0331 protein YutE [Lentibacillus sp. JNUCC-1]
MLVHIDQLLALYDKEKPFNSNVEHLALERLTHTLIESMLDVGNMMIDGFIMRDPGSYNDIIDIMVDERVLPESDQQAYHKLIELRQLLVQDYADIDHKTLTNVLYEYQQVLEKFSTHVTAYLDNELGVANAFTKD